MAEEQQTLSIRALGAEDFALWLPLWRGYQSFYNVALPDSTTRESFRRMLDDAEPMFGALAFSRDSAVGLVHWIFHRSNWSVGDYCYLQDLFVDESCRARGVGRRLIEHVYAQAAKAGCARVYWHTHETNQTAMALYDRIADRSGFIQYRKTL